MPRKSPLNDTDMSQPTLAPKKTVRRKRPAAPPADKQSYSPQSESPRRLQSSSSPAAAVAILIVMALIAAAAYFAYLYYNDKAAEEAALQDATAGEAAEAAAETPPAETPADPAADWLTFSLPSKTTTSAAGLLSFKYPKELQLTQNADNLILSSEQVPNTQVNIYWVKSAKTLKEYLAAMDKLNATGWEGQPSIAITTSTEAVVISGYPAIFRQQKLLAADLNQYVTFVKTADTVYSFSLAAPELDQNMLGFFVTFLNNLKIGQ